MFSRSKNFLCLVLALILTGSAGAETERTSLKLEGAALKGIQGNADGSLVFLGADFSPKPIYYSKDFGANWQFAAGGDYEAGELRGFEMFEGSIFAVLDRKLRKSALPSAGEVATWTPSWSTVSSPGPVTEIFRISQQHLFVSEGSRGYIFNISSSAIDSNSSIAAPVGGQFRAVIGGAGYLMATLTGATSGDRGNGNTALYRIAFNPSTGQVSGTWESIMDRLGVTLSQADLWSIFADSSSGTILAVVRNYEAGGADQTYTSVDDGSTFTIHPAINFSFNYACFRGDTWMMADYLSTDGGAGFTQMSLGGSTESLRIDRQGCYLVPNDGNKAITSTSTGVAYTTNLTTGPTWQTSRTGLEGVVVNRISQGRDNKDRAVMATYSGVGYTSNFTSSQPSWVYPICPNGGCNVLDYIVMDPNDSRKIYVGGKPNVSRGIVSEDGQSISWSAWGTSPFMSGNYGSFDIFNFDGLKNRLYTTWWKSEGGLGGGIYYYDLSYSGTSQSPTEVTDSDIQGKPVDSIYAVSSTVMFANRGGTRSSEEASLLAILESRDGGVNWTVMEMGALPSQPLIAAWAYDSKLDLLYAGISSMGTPPGWTGANVDGVYLLRNAAAGGGTWEKAAGTFLNKDGTSAAPLNLSDISVDVETGKIFVAASNSIWFSENQGASFNLVYAGVSGETTSDLEVDAEPAAEGQVNIRARRARLAQGANSGLYSFDINQISVPTPTPTPGPQGICGLSVGQRCKRPVAKNTLCEMSVTMKQANRKPASKGSFQLQRSTAKTGPWTSVGRVQRTDKKGLKTLRTKASATSFYRMVGVSHSCTSKTVQLKVIKSKKR